MRCREAILCGGIGTQFDSSFPFNEGYQILALDFGISIGFPVLDPNSITLQPNPANEAVTFKSDYVIRSIAIFTSDGKRIRDISNYDENHIDVSGLSNGLYVIRVMTQEGIWSSHLVVQH